MRVNWGARIVILYSSFVLFMGFMVYMCTQQHYDLVSSDYYAQELKYQEVIDGSNNMQALNQKIIIADAGNSYTVELPPAAATAPTGEIHFYCPSNAARDFKIPLSSAISIVPKNKVFPGVYKVKIRWTSGEIKYFDEQALTVKKQP